MNSPIPLSDGDIKGLDEDDVDGLDPAPEQEMEMANGAKGGGGGGLDDDDEPAVLNERKEKVTRNDAFYAKAAESLKLSTCEVLVGLVGLGWC